MVKNLHITVKGRVQGVGFRWTAYEKLVELGLIGKAENGKEGTVEIIVNGEEAVIEKFIEWAKVGPSGAQVSSVEAVETTESATHFGMETKNRQVHPVDKEE